MSDYIDKTISAYNLSPDKYVTSTTGMTPPAEFKRFIDRVGAGKSVLDAGCAFGRDCAELQKAGLKPTGIDLSDELLRKATTLHPDIDFHKMDVRKLNFADESFDGVWCHAVLLHLNDDDIPKALQEINRVLKPGGVLFVSFKKGDGAKEVVEEFSSNDARYFNFKTIEAVTSALENAGFLEVDAYEINEQDIFGPDKRDLTWIHCFATKPSPRT